jgi:lipoyl(octanoyl) transferase
VSGRKIASIVIYVHVDLKARSLDVSKFFKGLLESAQAAAKNSFGLDLDLNTEAPGLYVSGRKIASIGIQFKSFFTGHGLAINVTNDLSTFSLIDPCGFDSLEMTSVEKEGGRVDKTGLFIDLFYDHLQKNHLPERA